MLGVISMRPVVYLMENYTSWESLSQKSFDRASWRSEIDHSLGALNSAAAIFRLGLSSIRYGKMSALHL